MCHEAPLNIMERKCSSKSSYFIVKKIFQACVGVVFIALMWGGRLGRSDVVLFIIRQDFMFIFLIDQVINYVLNYLQPDHFTSSFWASSKTKLLILKK